MKKGWKIFWIICAVCTGIGLVCCGAAAAMGVTNESVASCLPSGIHLDGGIYIGDDGEYAKNVATIYGDDTQYFSGVTSIDADLWAGAVEIRHTGQDAGEIMHNTGHDAGESGHTGHDAAKIRQEHRNHTSNEVIVVTEGIDEKLGLKCYMDGNELKITTKKKLFHINHTAGVGKLYIYVPQDYSFEEVSLDVAAGRLYAEGIRAQEITVDVGAGEAVIDDFTAGEADFDCGAGQIIASGNAGTEVDLDCGVGEIILTVQGNESDYNYDIDCGIGKVMCGDSSYSGIGNEKQIHNNASKSMNIHCGIGEITVDFAEDF